MKKTRVLIVEDEKLIRWSLRQRFTEEGYLVDEAETGHGGLDKFGQATFDLVMLDYRLPDTTGLDVLRQLRAVDQEVVVIMMTAYSTIESAVEAIRLGAFDYLTKPFKMDELMLVAERGLETTQLKRQVRDFREQMRQRFGIDKILGQCPLMQDLFSMIKEIAPSAASTIFLRGASGTGKDLVAKILHYNSDRADRPFMNITCTALTESLLESELFGHERGAFTDAKAQKKGLLELADGGTVFLDEVGDMAAGLQAKLLRFLEEKAFRRVGGVHDIEVDVRVIAATNCDIEEAIKKGAFREDLFYRLNVIPIFMPPLRERGEDIDLLARHFVSSFATEFHKPVTGVNDAALAKLRAYAWPGNVRELRNAVERAVLLAKTEILGPEAFVLGIVSPTTAAASDGDGALAAIRLPAAGLDLADVERHLIKQALSMAENNRTRAARLLHISRDQLRYRMEKFGME